MRPYFAFIGVCLALASASYVCAVKPVYAQTSQRSSPRFEKASPEFVKMINGDMHRNIGKTLPRGIDVIDKNGNNVDLRSSLQSLHGPVILAIVTTLRCPPCEKLLEYVRKYPETYTQGKEVHLVVLRIKDSGHDSMFLPTSVVSLHTKDKLETGFLARHQVPEAFIFNRSLKLVKRRVGLSEPQDFLSYPATSDIEKP